MGCIRGADWAKTIQKENNVSEVSKRSERQKHNDSEGNRSHDSND